MQIIQHAKIKKGRRGQVGSAEGVVGVPGVDVMGDGGYNG